MYSTSYSKEQRIWRGREFPLLFNSQSSLAEAALTSMTTYGSKVAQINDDSGISVTFNEIKSKTIRAAKNLQSLGCKPKQVFTLIARNSHHVSSIFFASIAIGCPINTLDASFGRNELKHMLNITKSETIFCDVDRYEILTECLNELKIKARIFTFGGIVGGSEPVENLFKEIDNEDQFVPVSVDGQNDAAVIVCTSGSTGLSKGVSLSHAELLESVTRFPFFSSNDVLLCFSSCYWISGIYNILFGTFYGGCRIQTTHIFSPDLQLRLIEQYKITATINATHQIAMMMKSDRFKQAGLSSLKYVLIGGSKVPFHLKTAFSQHIPGGNLICCYGTSESCGIISMDYPPTMSKDTVGRLLPRCSIKIIDENGQRCEIKTEGEICIKTVHKFLGYYGNQPATDEVLEVDGFVKTGDFGYFDEDNDLFVTGRKKDQLKYSNFPISPSEIDDHLTKTAVIEAACVIGIPDAMGDLPAAVVVRTKGSNISETDVYDLVADHFSDHYKLRGGVYFVDALPLTPSGKVLRKTVKEMAIELFNSRSK